MPFLKNVSPYGDLDIPLLRRDVAAGEVFEVTAYQAECLAGQDENYLPVDVDGNPIEPAPVDLTKETDR